MDIDYELLGKDKVVISLRDFEGLLDMVDYDQATAKQEEAFPEVLTTHLIREKRPLKAFRKHRGLSQVELHQKSGVGQALISEIETGKKKGSISTLKALARALEIEVDDLL